jgi:hypothetical protein
MSRYERIESLMRLARLFADAQYDPGSDKEKYVRDMRRILSNGIEGQLQGLREDEERSDLFAAFLSRVIIMSLWVALVLGALYIGTVTADKALDLYREFNT